MNKTKHNVNYNCCNEDQMRELDLWPGDSVRVHFIAGVYDIYEMSTQGKLRAVWFGKPVLPARTD